MYLSEGHSRLETRNFWSWWLLRWFVFLYTDALRNRCRCHAWKQRRVDAFWHEIVLRNVHAFLLLQKERGNATRYGSRTGRINLLIRRARHISLRRAYMPPAWQLQFTAGQVSNCDQKRITNGRGKATSCWFNLIGAHWRRWQTMENVKKNSSI